MIYHQPIVNLTQFDAIIIPGGYAPDKMRVHQPMFDLVRKADDLGRIVAAICHGPQLLISAGMIKGRRVTSWPSLIRGFPGENEGEQICRCRHL